MAKSIINVRFDVELQCDGEKAEQRQWAWFRNELSGGIAAAESEFLPLDAEDLIAKAKQRKKVGSR